MTEHITDDLAALVDNDDAAIARHAEHLASCDDCRDARHDASNLADLVGHAGDDHVASDLADRVLAALDREREVAVAPTAQLEATTVTDANRAAELAPTAQLEAVTAATADREAAANREVAAPKPKVARRKHSPVLIAISASFAAAAGGIGIYAWSHHGAGEPAVLASTELIGKVTQIDRAAADHDGGALLREGTGWRALRKDEVLPAGAEVRTDERTRVSLELADGSRFVLDHRTTVAFDAAEARQLHVSGRIVADVTHVDNRPAAIATAMGRVDVVGTRFSVSATDTLTSVQVVRGAVQLTTASGTHDAVRAGEEGIIDHGALTVSAAPALARDLSWSELAAPNPGSDEVTAGLGALRAYKPGESRDRDWNLALAKHDVKVRISGPIARTEITETFRNDSTATLEGVYQFPLPADAQIDALALDSKDGMIEGAFVDKERAGKIWKGVIAKATPQIAAPSSEIIWVPGRWRDPALLDWKRGGRFELRVYPIPAKGARTIKLAYTQVVAPRGPWRQYVYPLPHSHDGSTVADQINVDVEVRGAAPGVVRAAGYDLVADPARRDVNALTLHQAGFVPRGDLVVDYRAADGDAELRAWTFAGGAAVAPDDKLAAKHGVGIDTKVVDAQRAVAADLRPTAVLALQPKLPRWTEDKARDYLIVIDASQSMVGERYTRASELAASLVDQMDRRDQFSVLACDSECRRFGDLRAPSTPAVGELRSWLAATPPAGASDLVTAIRTATGDMPHDADREHWVMYVGDGFASTGFRREADVERAIADSTTGVHVTTIGIGTDVDAPLLAAAARGGGGSYLAWVPGESAKTAALAVMETTLGAALRDATVELPAGLADVAPSLTSTPPFGGAAQSGKAGPCALPTMRAGEEVLLAARVTGEVTGDVILRGTVAGQKFEQHYPLQLAVSAAPGNGFVPRLWASLAIDQLERAGHSDDRTRIVALSQGYGVMSRETSLLVLESQAMFDAFGIDRHTPAATWTGEESLDEVATAGNLPLTPPAKPAASGHGKIAMELDPSANKDSKSGSDDDDDKPRKRHFNSTPKVEVARAFDKKAPAHAIRPAADGFDDHAGMVQMRRTWIRIPSISPYDTVSSSITKAIADADAALVQHPDSRERHRNLVQALSYAGELDRARDIAARWLERDKLDPQALGYEADLLGRDGQRDLALRTLAGLVDLDADRVALHERMVRAYEAAGRLAQACGHRIALAALEPRDASVSGAAARCLRGLARERDAELILRALPDALRTAAEKAATVALLPARVAGDLVVHAHWTGNADLDVSIVTPDGTRVSWMGGRSDVAVADATSTEREELAVRTLRRGNYLVEISRGAPGRDPVRGTLDIAALGEHRAIPFELVGNRLVVGRIGISLEERLEEVDTGQRWHRGGRETLVPN